MATTFVPCRDEAHVRACHEAGLLWLNRGSGGFPHWTPSDYATLVHVLTWYSNGRGQGAWRPEEFAVLVED